MFIEKQLQKDIDYYEKMLKAIGSLSNLFSEALEPYLAPRTVENLFCKAFDAKNLSRSDVSADASKDRIGLGIKTFIDGNGKSMQKVAEFNRDSILFTSLSLNEKIRKIAELRNARIEVTKKIFGLDQLIYHCITRQAGKILIYETPFDLIDIDKIRNIKPSKTGGTIKFSDSKNEYSFHNSKSTLSKRFITENIITTLPVRIIVDPFAEIEKIISEAGLIFAPIKEARPHVFLPLYSIIDGAKKVPERSGLNQWNASGRKRNSDELYIPIPAWIHKKYPTFFPDVNAVFELTLPDRTVLKAGVCQSNRKALMSNPNSDLGKWLLRGVMNLKEGQLATYDNLQTMGLDSVVVYKIDNNHYDIDFTRIGAFEKFEIENEIRGKIKDEIIEDQNEEE